MGGSDLVGTSQGYYLVLEQQGPWVGCEDTRYLVRKTCCGVEVERTHRALKEAGRRKRERCKKCHGLTLRKGAKRDLRPGGLVDVEVARAQLANITARREEDRRALAERVAAARAENARRSRLAHVRAMGG